MKRLLLLLALLPSLVVAQGSTVCTNTPTNVAANWTAGLPTAATNAVFDSALGTPALVLLNANFTAARLICTNWTGTLYTVNSRQIAATNFCVTSGSWSNAVGSELQFYSFADSATVEQAFTVSTGATVTAGSVVLRAQGARSSWDWNAVGELSTANNARFGYWSVNSSSLRATGFELWGRTNTALYLFCAPSSAAGTFGVSNCIVDEIYVSENTKTAVISNVVTRGLTAVAWTNRLHTVRADNLAGAIAIGSAASIFQDVTLVFTNTTHRTTVLTAASGTNVTLVTGSGTGLEWTLQANGFTMEQVTVNGGTLTLAAALAANTISNQSTLALDGYTTTVGLLATSGTVLPSNSTIVVSGSLVNTGTWSNMTETVVGRGATISNISPWNLSFDTGGTTNTIASSMTVRRQFVAVGSASNRVVASVNGVLNIQSNAQSYVAFTDWTGGSVSNKPVTGYSVWSSNSATGIRQPGRYQTGGL
jgi:hypothetical protein